MYIVVKEYTLHRFNKKIRLEIFSSRLLYILNINHSKNKTFAIHPNIMIYTIREKEKKQLETHINLYTCNIYNKTIYNLWHGSE